MSILSFKFWVLFPILFLFYWLLPKRWAVVRRVFLILVSYAMYMSFKPAYALILIGVTVITYFGALLVGGAVVRRRGLLIWSLSLLVLLPLIVFKYWNFLNGSLSDVFAGLSLPGLNWAIPVGISFFTFQALGYLLDVYYRRIEPETSFVNYTLFVCFFPQIASGPISKASEMLPQIAKIGTGSSDISWSLHQMSDNKIVTGGGKFLLWGLFLKLVIADRLGLFVDAIYGNPLRFSGLQCLAGSLGYTLQIYTDFAGYSYIAMGLAKLLGFNLINNFARPYFSVSVTDFWRRWHISLSRWLKDYVYIPLGGNRCSKARNYWNIFVTFLVSGVWHGANWTFVVWGLLHGLAQIVEKFFGIQKCDSSYRWVRGLRIVLTFCLVSFLWILFRSPSIGDAAFFVNRIFTAGGSADIIGIMSFTNFVSLALALPILVFKDVRDEWQVGKWRFCDQAVVRWIAYLVLFAMVLNMGVFDGGQFIYVSF